MNCRWGLIGGSIIVFGIVTGLIAAQEKSAKDAGKGAQREPDEKAIRETSKAFARAFEKGDAKAVAGFWTETGEYVDEGAEPMSGRAAIEKAYADFFGKRHEVRVEGTSDLIRFLAQDVAVEEGTFTVRSKGAGFTSSRYSALFVREKGKWLMATLKEWGDDTTNRANLRDLAWLIGTWESDGAEQKVRTTYEWTENKTFIRCQYTITGKKDNKMASSGMQMIGIDPLLNQVRAWTFDADGVFAMIRGNETSSNDIFQLAIDSAGIVRGNYYNAVSNATQPVSGSLDKKTQRLAWSIADKKDTAKDQTVYECGLYNLTQNETTLLVHFGKDHTDQYKLFRVPQPQDGKDTPTQGNGS